MGHVALLGGRLQSRCGPPRQGSQGVVQTPADTPDLMRSSGPLTTGSAGHARPRTMRWSFYLTGLTLSNYERQVHVVRGRRAAERPPHPDLKPDNQSCQGEGAGGS